MEKTVLIVEDERAIVEILKFNLKKEGYRTCEALDGDAGLALARSADPDLILLDVMLPKRNGFEICKVLRAESNAVPIIMLTAREEESDKVFGLESGADDYITKPFSMRELMARVKANIRRRIIDATGGKGAVMTHETLALNPASCAVTKNGAPVELTQKEYDLLKFFMSSPGLVFSREELMKRVWNYEFYGDMRTVDVTIRRLREKIEDDPGQPRWILTRRGVGYLFSES
ncbi:MAG: response regulator transcription factor [Oscillospiraceae bacterium]|nr:response regulator transcription factor [Oscillospiraceae bacterium]